MLGQPPKITPSLDDEMENKPIQQVDELETRLHQQEVKKKGYLEKIENLQRPITMEAGSIVLMDLLWSDPTENDSVEGLRPNARGPGLVTFGVRFIPICPWKRISGKRTKNQAKNDKTEHGMEKRGKDKVKSKPKSTKVKVNPEKSTVKTGADTEEYLMSPPEPI
ncbi:serine/threonine-protein phosphatase BSL3 [Tanacetum coccineum]